MFIETCSSGNGDYLYMGNPALAPAPIPVKSERKRSRKETRETDYLAMLLTNRGKITITIFSLINFNKPFPSGSVSFSRTPQVQSNDVDGTTDAQTNQPFSTRDLTCWAFQIARGMDYLSGRNVSLLSWLSKMVSFIYLIYFYRWFTGIWQPVMFYWQPTELSRSPISDCHARSTRTAITKRRERWVATLSFL